MQLTKLVSSLTMEKILVGKPHKNTEIETITCRSGQAEATSLFVCIRGALADGHEYAPAAYQKGCRAFLVDHRLDLPANALQIIVPEGKTHAAMAYLSLTLYAYPSWDIPIIGITGTKGKTTTALLITHVLNENGIPTGYIGTNGIQYGGRSFPSINTTPDVCELQYHLRQMVNAGMRCAVVEVSSQALKTGRVLGMRFFRTVFTNFSPDHIGPREHPDLSDYKACKAKLFSDFESAGVLYNADDPAAADIIAGTKAPRKSYGMGHNVDFAADDLSLTRTATQLGIDFTLTTPKLMQYKVSLPIPGEFNVYNALCAIAVCTEMEVPVPDILRSLTDVRIPGRFEVYPLSGGATAVIDYAHNGISLRSALETLRAYHPNRLLCLFGSVGGRTKGRRADMGAVAAKLCDFCILTSDNPDNEPPMDIINDIAAAISPSDCSYTAIPDRAEAIRYAVSLTKPGDILLLAGKGHEKTQLIAGHYLPFSEAGILADYVAVPETVVQKT